MDSLLCGIEWSMTTEEFRTKWNTYSDEHRFQLVCQLMDVTHAARRLNAQYTHPRYGNEGINQPPWAEVQPQWDALGYHLRQMFGPKWLSTVESPKFYLNWGDLVLQRCNIPNTPPKRFLSLDPSWPLERIRIYLRVVGTYICDRLVAEQVPVQALKFPGDSLESVLVMFTYPLEWYTIAVPGATDPELVVAAVLKYHEGHAARYSTRGSDVTFQQLPQGQPPCDQAPEASPPLR